MFTGEIARYGGKVTPEFRAWYFDMKAKQEAAALEEQKQVGLYAESIDARGKAGNSKSSSPFSFDNEKFMSVLVSINDTINEVKNLFMNWATKGPTQ
jgi:hypothetical protein